MRRLGDSLRQDLDCKRGRSPPLARKRKEPAETFSVAGGREESGSRRLFTPPLSPTSGAPLTRPSLSDLGAFSPLMPRPHPLFPYSSLETPKQEGFAKSNWPVEPPRIRESAVFDLHLANPAPLCKFERGRPPGEGEEEEEKGRVARRAFNFNTVSHTHALLSLYPVRVLAPFPSSISQAE